MFSQLSFKPYIYAAFALIILVMCWESNLVNAAIVDQTIPRDSIRLRILANSDNPEDQMVKRRVRDEIIKQMNTWVKGPQGMEGITRLEDARVMVRLHLKELHQLVTKVVHQYGQSYSNEVELAVVPFPVKTYGTKVYPAGDYEAVRVTLGTGKGLNWWCVLYPPLCFINFSTTSDDITVDKAAIQKAAKNGEIKRTERFGSAGEDRLPQESGEAEMTEKNVNPEVKFLVWETIKELSSFFRNM